MVIVIGYVGRRWIIWWDVARSLAALVPLSVRIFWFEYSRRRKVQVMVRKDGGINMA